MGRPPAYIFVVRHGNRLDAADKQWHLSSPTPYDPPLTYSGWTQSRALGLRIGEILRERLLDDDRPSASPGAKPKGGRKFRVIIHSSPFLRCVQTSVGISAGLASDPAPLQSPLIGGYSPRTSQPSSPLPSPGISPAPRPAISIDTRQPLRPVPSPATDDEAKAESKEIPKIVLRLDAFLGEWLSPSYFELITPPPGSVMMIASAKAELLRRENYNSYPHFQLHQNHAQHHHRNQNHAAHNHGHLWNSSPRASPVATPPAAEDLPPLSGLDSLSGMATSLPRSGSVGSHHHRPGRLVPMPAVEGNAYVAPTPTFAVSSKAPIPAGYVAHARDACVQVDYQWDSMRAPYDWGDGGEYGEEWTSMHKRFRHGLQKMVEWYSDAEKPYKMVTRLARSSTNGSQPGKADPEVEEPEDEDAENVVILVSHGAGCNALIGGITHQPVLMDVGLCSLTMAVRKPAAGNGLNGSHADVLVLPSEKHGASPVHKIYDLKMFANTDHVRSNAPTPTASRSSSMANAMGGIRGRYSGSFSSPLGSPYIEAGGSRSSSANAAFSDYRRASGHSSGNHAVGGITVGSGVTSFTNPTGLSRTPSIGLWSPAAARKAEEAFEDESEPDMVLNFGDDGKYTSSHLQHETADPKATEKNGPATAEEPLVPAQPPTPGVDEAEKGDTISQLSQLPTGLWGQQARPVRPVDLAHHRTISSSKRRWTVNERT
ncbi:uncharacterized protein E0L32_000266 [Thyridium curvatum]|uniref:Phosphoglycerate mutase n=1 Tax=Thyridium curvatum TaxID=1093900 RepID=A0A507B0Z0_9PEZI|nr:uncharacterized protein E0L32_000266 [Thyridium curvatum]TPX15932.1 hypothetical protein E0L32_000266 [Thyridium curvatum]